MYPRQRGFALIMSMLVLLMLSIVVLNAVRSNVLNERMAGAYMDRTRAFQAAEQAIQQGKAALMSNTAVCFESALGCSFAANGTATAIASGTQLPTSMPESWAGAGTPVAMTLASSQTGRSSGSFAITRFRDAGGQGLQKTINGTFDSNCKAYSIMGRGQGTDADAVVIIQVVTWLCPA